jgi:hypothetical protein
MSRLDLSVSVTGHFLILFHCIILHSSFSFVLSFHCFQALNPYLYGPEYLRTRRKCEVETDEEKDVKGRGEEEEQIISRT